MNLLLLGLLLYPRLEVKPPNLFPYRGIYIYPFAAVKFTEYLPYIRNSEINCVVVDFKTDEGYVTYDSNVKLAQKIGAVLPIINLENIVRICRWEGLILIGRIVVFKDKALANYDRGRYSLKGADKKIWQDGHGHYWVDPSLAETRNYNIAIAKELASRGVEEIQFDYIRFPSTTGNFKPYIVKCKSKREVIASFLREAKTELESYGVTVSGDVYGCALWMPTLPEEGQSLELMAPSLDVICPMLYPSHFQSSYKWTPNLREREYNVIFGSLERGAALLGESRFVPYIQGFNLRTWDGFGPEYIANQIKAVQDSKAWGYIIWHAASKYEPVWELFNKGISGYGVGYQEPTTVAGKIRQILDRDVRPYLELQGGDVELVSVKDGIVKVRLLDGCLRSPLEEQFYLNLVSTSIKEKVAEVKEVVGE